MSGTARCVKGGSKIKCKPVIVIGSTDGGGLSLVEQFHHQVKDMTEGHLMRPLSGSKSPTHAYVTTDLSFTESYQQ